MSDNIKVVVKVRPLISREIDDKLFYQWRVQNDTLYQIDQNEKDVGPSFSFDKVYAKESKTEDVYNDIAKPIVEAATAGFNGTIFAYGQTSSGKTYTMTGTDEAPGIIPLAIINLFEIIKNVPDRDFLVRVSFVEIYNETLIDLFNIDKKIIKIQDTLQGVKVDASEKVASSPEEVLGFMKEGQANRQTSATNMNEESSRSHSIFQITIESREHTDGENECGCVNVSQLNLVDLAGSERAGQTGATGLRFKEGTHINKSLSSLALVIKQLSDDPHRHVNYRDSKLTRILQNSLGGNAKTSIICAITPAAVEETISTLQFANRAKSIKNKPAVNEVATDATMIQRLTKQLSFLKTELENKKSVEKNNHNLQKQIAALQRLILNGFGQRNTTEILNRRRKPVQQRRITISTLHAIQEDPQSPTISVPKFCTPSLKYNPFVIGASDFKPIHTSVSLSTLPEETPRTDSPPPRDKKINLDDEIIEIDSEDDITPESQVCPTSPYHKCYDSSKTPPCILRKNSKRAEKDLRDILELTKREKILQPDVEEVMKKLEQNATVTAKLEEEINKLNASSKEKDSEMEKLMIKLNEAEKEIQKINLAKLEIETICKDYDTKLTDLEVSYETLKKKAKSREEELLSLLEERVPKKVVNKMDAIPESIENKQSKHFLEESSCDISLVNSDNEQSIIGSDNKTSNSLHKQVTNLQEMLDVKDTKIGDLEAIIQAQEEKIISIEKVCQDYQSTLNDYKEQHSHFDKEALEHKQVVDSLNRIIETQKENIESLNSDIQSYKDIVQDLQIKLRSKDCVKLNINDSELQSLIEKEEIFIANNDNIKNLIHSLNMALQLKTEELTSLKISHENDFLKTCDDLKTELENRNKEVTNLTDQIQNLKVQIEGKVIIINKLLLEQNNWLETEKQLKLKIGDLEEANSNLTKENGDFLNQLKNIDTLKEEFEKELIKSNNYKKHIEEMCHEISKLKHEADLQDNIIESLKKAQEETNEHLIKAKFTVSKVHNIMSILTGSCKNVPDIIDNFVTLFNSLSNDLCSLEDIAQEIIVQKSKLIDFINKCGISYESIEKQIDVFIEAISNNSDLNNLQFLSESFSINELENEKLTQNKEIQEVFCKSQSASSLLRLKINKLMSLVTLEKATYLEKIQKKENEISELRSFKADAESNIMDKTKELLLTRQKVDDVQLERDQILNNILSKCIDVTRSFNMEDNNSYKLENNEDDLYKEILLTLNKLGKHIEIMNNSNEIDKLDEVLLEAKKEIQQLTEQNIKFLNDVSHMEATNFSLSDELDKIRIENKILAKDLENSSKVLGLLQEELKNKVNEMDSIEVKARQWKDQFVTLDFLIKEQMYAFQSESAYFMEKYHQSLKINENCDNEHNSNDENNSYQQSSGFNTNNTLVSPQSLLTLCCNRIVDAIQLNENENVSVNKSQDHSSFSSNTVSDHDTLTSLQHSSCQCDNLKLELIEAKDNNFELKSEIEHLRNKNKSLDTELNEVENEVKSLLEVTSKLQKNIISHRTILSTLTATTYAENKSLSSQIKSMQHHHNRFHLVCQRDIPALKTQLQELMILLKNENMMRNDSFKRFSLPDTLETSRTISNLRNESTLDADLLMLDTNVTITTVGDITLVGQDQTCCDVTQVCVYNDVASQTIESTLTNSTLLNSQIVDTPDFNEIMEKLEELKKENNKLRDIVNVAKLEKYKDVQTSPIKANIDVEGKECVASNHQDLLNTLENYLKEIDSLTQKLSSLESEKSDILNKYNNLLLEVPSTDALVKKLGTIEREYNSKTNELDKVKATLYNKNKEIAELQEENDSLSTQVMEAITELDDLKKVHDELKVSKSQILDKSCQIQNQPDCPRCESKDKLISSLEEKLSLESHIRLGRSFSDSDRSSSYNTICTLQSELHAGKEDCDKLKKEVTTIKNHLDRSNFSMSQAMDLDDSMGEPNNFSYTKDVNVNPKCNITNICEERPLDIYAVDKADCISYYAEMLGIDKEDLDYDIKIIDVMKMLYNKILAKHANEVENLVNNLRDFEDSKKQLKSQLEGLTREHSSKTKELQERETELQSIQNTMSYIKDNMLYKFNKDLKYTEIIENFREGLLKPIDIQFALNSTITFDSLLNTVVNKFESDLHEKQDQCIKLEENLKQVQDEFASANSNLLKLKSELTEKENDCILLKKKNDSIQEISNAVTLDIVKKEQEIEKILTEGCKKLAEHNILEQGDIVPILPVYKNIESVFTLIVKHFCDKQKTQLELDDQKISQELTDLEMAMAAKDKELHSLTECLHEKDNELSTQTNLFKDLTQIYDKKVEENNVNLAVIQKMNEEINMLKESLSQKQSTIQTLESNCSSGEELNKNLDGKIKELLNNKESITQEIEVLKASNKEIVKENNNYAQQLHESTNIIKANKKELESLTSDILALKESVKENVSVIENMKQDLKVLSEENSQLKEQLQEKCRECSRLEMNIKTHEKTAEIQSRIITRLKKQLEEVVEKDKQIDELKQKCIELQSECDGLSQNIKISKEEVLELKKAKQLYEEQISDLQAQVQETRKPRLSIEAVADASRRRRQSIHDSMRMFSTNRSDCDDHSKMESLFGSRTKNEDLFMDVDGADSNRSTPLRRGRNSSQHKHDQSDKDEDPTRPSSVPASRLRRQSAHDLHRSTLSPSPSPHDLLHKLGDVQSHEKSDTSDSEVIQLKKQLTSCMEELEDLKERYKELDDECEICAQYLKERDEQCSQLRRAKQALENTVAELKGKVQNTSLNKSVHKISCSDASVNTDEDWTNLHSLVVDRMSYNVEVEKNKKLTKIIEDLRYKKEDLKATMAKMQKALEKKSNDRELEASRSELASCKQELEALRQRCMELDEECETCAEYLRERDAECRKLKEAKTSLEAKLMEYMDDSNNITHSLRKKRQTLHDQNRSSSTMELVDAATETSEDFLSYLVEKDTSQQIPQDGQLNELKHLRIMVEKLSQQRAAAPLYVASGSAIVQNQQLTDVMKENQKLKRINAKLINICKKRGKTLSESNRENQDPTEHA